MQNKNTTYIPLKCTRTRVWQVCCHFWMCGVCVIMQWNFNSFGQDEAYFQSCVIALLRMDLLHWGGQHVRGNSSVLSCCWRGALTPTIRTTWVQMWLMCQNLIILVVLLYRTTAKWSDVTRHHILSYIFSTTKSYCLRDSVSASLNLAGIWKTVWQLHSFINIHFWTQLNWPICKFLISECVVYKSALKSSTLFHQCYYNCHAFQCGLSLVMLQCCNASVLESFSFVHGWAYIRSVFIFIFLGQSKHLGTVLNILRTIGLRYTCTCITIITQTLYGILITGWWYRSAFSS